MEQLQPYKDEETTLLHQSRRLRNAHGSGPRPMDRHRDRKQHFLNIPSRTERLRRPSPIWREDRRRQRHVHHRGSRGKAAAEWLVLARNPAAWPPQREGSEAPEEAQEAWRQQVVVKREFEVVVVFLLFGILILDGRERTVLAGASLAFALIANCG
jgi:hypothetical protein